MPRVPTTPFPFLLAAALATAFMPDRATRAGVVLAVDDPQHNGVMVWDGTPMAQDRDLLRRARVPHGALASRTHAGISPRVGVVPESRRWKWAA